MKYSANNVKQNKSRSAATKTSRSQRGVEPLFQLIDNRPQANVERQLRNILQSDTHVSTAQLKPKNIKKTDVLDVDNTGQITNAGAGRVDPPVSYPLNTALDLGLLKSKSGAAVGGHMFKREYGGLDNYSNVVTWSEKSEASFTKFENEYLAKARTDALGNGGVSREVHSEATFSSNQVNLNSIKLPDKVMPNGGIAENRTIKNASTTSDTKAARHLLTRVISGAMESIPAGVTVKSKGVEPWSKEGKDGFMGVSGKVIEDRVAERYDYIADGVGEDRARLERAAAKVDEM